MSISCAVVVNSPEQYLLQLSMGGFNIKINFWNKLIPEQVTLTKCLAT